MGRTNFSLDFDNLNETECQLAINDLIHNISHSAENDFQVTIYFDSLVYLSHKKRWSTAARNKWLYGLPRLLKSNGWSYTSVTPPTCSQRTVRTGHPLSPQNTCEIFRHKVLFEVTKAPKVQVSELGKYHMSDVNMIGKVVVQVRGKGAIEDPEVNAIIVAKVDYFKVNWIGGTTKSQRLFSVDPNTGELYFVSGAQKGEKLEALNHGIVAQEILDIITR